MDKLEDEKCHLTKIAKVAESGTAMQTMKLEQAQGELERTREKLRTAEAMMSNRSEEVSGTSGGECSVALKTNK